MFGFGRKKSQLEKAIEKDGIEHATDRVAEIVAANISNMEIAYRSILEEIEGASMGNDASKIFAKNSGISPSEYKGAMRNSIPEVDGPLCDSCSAPCGNVRVADGIYNCHTGSLGQNGT